MLDHLTPKHPPRVVCAIYDMSQGTLGTWLHRGRLDGLQLVRPGPGKTTLWNTVSALALGLVIEADTYSMMPVELPGMAYQAAADWLRHRPHVRELHIRWYPGPDSAVSMSYNSEVMKDPPRPGWTLSLVFDLDAIFGKAEAKLNEFYAAQERGETRVEPLSPTLIGGAADKSELERYEEQIASATSEER